MAEGDEALLSLARERFAVASERDEENRREAKEDLKFKVGGKRQWPSNVLTLRERDNRAVLTSNRLKQYVRNVVNEQRQARPGVKVRSTGADDEETQDVRRETARLYEGLIRCIENKSSAETAYDHGFEYTVSMGWGSWRVNTEYESDDSLDQCLRIERIKNPFSVLWDPGAQRWDKSDARYCFVVERMSTRSYEEAYPDSEAASLPAGLIPTGMEEWFAKDEVMVTEYWYVAKKSRTLVKFSDGSTRVIPEGEDHDDWVELVEEREGVTVDGKPVTRKVDEVKWCKMNGVEILERSDWLGKYIPIIEMCGDETSLDGTDIRSGLIRDAKDPQRMYNYWLSHAAEIIALAPKSPMIATSRQIAQHKEQWEQAHAKNIPVLVYDHHQGHPQPKRLEPMQTPTGVVQMSMMAANDINETTGLHQANLGKPSNEVSGIAIAQRKEQGNLGTMHYQDNLARAIAHTGRVLIDLIPKIYNSRRAVEIMGVDGETETVTLYQRVLDPATGQGYMRNDLNDGTYDVYVDSGPSYATRRQEEAAMMMQVIQTSPDMMPLIGDLLFRSLDIEGAREIAERLARLVPPEALGEAPPPQPGQGPPNGAPMPPGTGMPPGMPPGMVPPPEGFQ